MSFLPEINFSELLIPVVEKSFNRLARKSFKVFLLWQYPLALFSFWHVDTLTKSITDGWQYSSKLHSYREQKLQIAVAQTNGSTLSMILYFGKVYHITVFRNALIRNPKPLKRVLLDLQEADLKLIAQNEDNKIKFLEV